MLVLVPVQVFVRVAFFPGVYENFGAGVFPVPVFLKKTETLKPFDLKFCQLFNTILTGNTKFYLFTPNLLFSVPSLDVLYQTLSFGTKFYNFSQINFAS